ncbi:hypothetical protein [Microbacterium atlanticum]|nr:hypothetical protein [Microbacterium atlanticum]
MSAPPHDGLTDAAARPSPRLLAAVDAATPEPLPPPYSGAASSATE